jgi:hypothetical protein
MKKKPKRISLICLLICFFACLFLTFLSLYEYYWRYTLLESGLVLSRLYSYFFFPLFVLLSGILYKMSIKRPLVVGLLGTFLSSLLLLGLITFINCTVGHQKNRTLSGYLVDKKVGHTRAGEGDYYFTVYDSATREQYILRSVNDYFFETKPHDTISIQLKEGLLGILYR